MSNTKDWKEFWEKNSTREVSDYEFDRGNSPRDAAVEALANAELVEFIAPAPEDEVFDAGCGTGSNLILLHDRVRQVVGMDYSAGAVGRCQKRVVAAGIQNVRVMEGSVTAPPLGAGAVNKVICMSVLQYLSDADVRLALREFHRVLRPDGTLVLHVKNLSSLYLATLRLAKRVKALLGGQPKLEYVRTYSWYVRELRQAGFVLERYNSFNLLVVVGMPRSWVRFVQGLELRWHQCFPFSTGFLRRRGADLKLKARREGLLSMSSAKE